MPRQENKVKNVYHGFSCVRHLLDYYVVEEDGILTIGHFKGTQTGPFMGKPATGAQISAVVMHLDRVYKGRIVEHHAQIDFIGLIQQLEASFT